MKKRLTLEVGWLYMYTDTEPAATRITIAMEMPASRATGCCSALSPAVSSSSAAQTQHRALSSTYTLTHTVCVNFLAVTTSTTPQWGKTLKIKGDKTAQTPTNLCMKWFEICGVILFELQQIYMQATKVTYMFGWCGKTSPGHLQEEEMTVLEPHFNNKERRVIPLRLAFQGYKDSPSVLGSNWIKA